MKDWSWKLQEAVDRIKSRYEHIGRKTGAPFLAIVYPPEAEIAVLKEWRTLLSTLDADFVVQYVDLLDVTMKVVSEFGGADIVAALANPMPGSDPNAELNHLWVQAVATAVHEQTARSSATSRPVVVLERLAALYPVAGPRAVMQVLWDSERAALEGPVIVLIPGHLIESRVYAFLGRHQELMYRGDIL